MQSGRLAVVVVVEQNPMALTKPRVKVFYSTKEQMPIPVRLVDVSHSMCSDRIIGRESNSQWQFKQLDELWAGAEALARTGRG